MKQILTDTVHKDIKEEFIIYLNFTSNSHEEIFQKYLHVGLSAPDWEVAKLYGNFCNIEGFLTYLQQKKC